MPFCQVIKSNDRPCAAYARKGLTCCYAHRKLENTEVVAPNPCDPKYSPTEPVEPTAVVVAKPVVPYETIYINPWDDDDIWNCIIEAIYVGPERFLLGLRLIADGQFVFNKVTRFVFHKSLAAKHVTAILSLRTNKIQCRITPQGLLTVFIDKERK